LTLQGTLNLMKQLHEHVMQQLIFFTFLQPDVTMQHQSQVTTPVSHSAPSAEPVQEPNVQAQAPIEASDQAAAAKQEGSCFPWNVTENPLFEDEECFSAVGGNPPELSGGGL
jgi:hypothetical protein